MRIARTDGAGETGSTTPGAPADTVRLALGQQRVLHRKFGGLIHLCIFSAFIVLFIVTCSSPWSTTSGSGSSTATSTSSSKLFAEDVRRGAAPRRRGSPRPPRRLPAAGGYERERRHAAASALGAIGVTGFSDRDGPHRGDASGDRPDLLVSNGARAGPLRGDAPPEILFVHKTLWWTHLLIAFGFLASIP